MEDKKETPMNGYTLTRNWFNFKFENQGVLKSVDAELYFYIVDQWNRLGQINVMGLPTDFTMQALEIASYKTYKKALDKLIENNFIIEVSKSKNIHMSRKIALVKNANANTKALDKATINAHTNDSTNETTIEHTTITKPLNNKQKNNKTTNNTLLSEIVISDLEGSEIEYFEIAKTFRDLFIKNLKEKNAPAKNQEFAKFKNYVDPIRLMIENDNVKREQLKKVFNFLSSPEGDFWKPNILSTKKLREKFSQLIMKCETESTYNKAKQGDLSSNRATSYQGGASAEYRRKTAERLGLIDPINNSKFEKENRTIYKNPETVVWPSFEDFWNEYDKQIGRVEIIESKWEKLPQHTKEEIMTYITEYKISQPDKQFRKNPEAFLDNHSWKDEIVRNRMRNRNSGNLKASVEGTFNAIDAMFRD